MDSCCYIYLYVLPRHHGSEQFTGNTWGRTPVYPWRTGKVAQEANNTEEDERLDISYSENVKLVKPILLLFIVNDQLMIIYVVYYSMYLTYCFSTKTKFMLHAYEYLY